MYLQFAKKNVQVHNVFTQINMFKLTKFMQIMFAITNKLLLLFFVFGQSVDFLFYLEFTHAHY